MENIPQSKLQIILFAHNTSEIKTAVTQYLKHGYEIIEVENFLQLLETVEKEPKVNAIIIDLTLPHFDELNIIHTLKSNFSTFHIPIIVMINQEVKEDLELIVEMEVDDFVKNPFDASELNARLIINIRRSERDQNVNPLTKLPGNLIIERMILQHLNQPMAVMYADLDNFKVFNDKYGFNKGDSVI